MAEVKILIEGYTSGKTDGHSCSTIVLVRDKNINIVVDPGTLSFQNVLVEKLKQEGLKVDDINIVFLTHAHMDHSRNTGMFPKARVINHEGYWEGDFWGRYDENITENIKILKTQGHSDDSITLLVDTDEGKIAICGDVFWEKWLPKKDIYATDEKELEKSRKKVLQVADFVIPGHGKMFKTD